MGKRKFYERISTEENLYIEKSNYSEKKIVRGEQT